ncbi:MAG: alpha/beta hydrolase [Acidobacteriia bacterium]|nr:alpha/beta hydrolase [Terriglobia bacterium]
MKSQLAKRKISLALLTVVPASLAVAGALVYRRYRRDLTAARTRVSSGSKLANTPSGLIEYADVGTGAPVFVIHGAGGGFDQGLEFARPLVDAGFRVIAPSRFGYLRTPLPKDASPMAQADAHASLLDSLQLEKVAVLGVSAGAPSAMQLCLRHPKRCTSLVLAVPLVYSGAPAGAPPSALREFLANTAVSSDFIFWAMSKLARNTMFKTVLGTPPEDVEQAGAEEQARITEVLDHIEPVSQRKKGLQNEAAVARSLPRYDLEHLQLPTLVSSIEDCLYNTYPGARYTAENIPGARFLGYPTGGHLAVGHEAELWSEVRQFLQTAA